MGFFNLTTDVQHIRIGLYWITVPAVTKSSTSTQSELLPYISSVKVTTSAASSLPTVSKFRPLPACPVQTTITTANNIPPSTSQDVKQTSKPRKMKFPPKNTSASIKPKIEIMMAPHKPRKPAPVEYITDEENMIVYDIEEQVETTKSIVRRLSEEYWRYDD
ncbi:hypothetical protein TNCV_331701 [Trichonephila clavipes]|nr:hypothetical protein TNCV_331701 [Trichonephila clavipes]